MVDGLLEEGLHLEQLVEFGCEADDLGEVEGTEVRKERVVLQVLVSAKVEGVADALGRGLVGEPVEAVGDDGHGLLSVSFHPGF